MNFDAPDQMCSNGGGRCSKKQKQKKIPQRGLGVAQLEKIRIEQLRNNKDSTNSTLTSPPRTLSPTTSSTLPSPFLNYSSSHSSSSSQNPILRQPPPLPNVDSFYFNGGGGGGFDVGWPSVPTLDDTTHLRKMWNPYELNRHEETSGWDHGFLLPPTMSLPFESNPNMPLPDIMTRELQFSQASASLLMNMPSSSMYNFQTGPSLDQSFYTNISSLWPDQEKMSCAKRPYHFPYEAPPLPSFHNKIARRSNESTSCGNSILFNYDPDGSTLQETRLLPSSNANKETGNQNGDFLSLAPPHRTMENPSVKSPRSTILDHRIPGTLAPKNGENLGTRPGQGQSDFNHQKSLFSFFPAIKSQKETPSINMYCNSAGSGEVGGILDLNLKL